MKSKLIVRVCPLPEVLTGYHCGAGRAWVAMLENKLVRGLPVTVRLHPATDGWRVELFADLPAVTPDGCVSSHFVGDVQEASIYRQRLVDRLIRCRPRRLHGVLFLENKGAMWAHVFTEPGDTP